MIRVAIPTYKRSDSIASKTLKYLKSVNYPANLIYLFVVAEEEHLYKGLPADLYGHIVIGPVGLCAMRNRITDFFDEGEIIMQFDDDVSGIKSTLSFSEIFQILYKGLTDKDAPCGLAGVLPNNDTRRFKNSQTMHLAHILGSFFMCRNHKDIKITHTEKEDMERSILYYKRYGRVLRYQNAGVSTNYKGGTGGLQSQGRSERCASEIESLKVRFPNLVSEVEKVKGRDLILNWRVSDASAEARSSNEQEVGGGTGRASRIKDGILNLISRYPQYCQIVKKKSGEIDVVLKWRQSVRPV